MPLVLTSEILNGILPEEIPFSQFSQYYSSTSSMNFIRRIFRELYRKFSRNLLKFIHKIRMNIDFEERLETFSGYAVFIFKTDLLPNDSAHRDGAFIRGNCNLDS